MRLQVDLNEDALGRIYNEPSASLGGETQRRQYVFTWITPWGEESIASRPSAPEFVKEGRVVIISQLPSEFEAPLSSPGGDAPQATDLLGTWIRGIRLYRTLSTVNDSEYFLLRTLWFPVGIRGFILADDGTNTDAEGLELGSGTRTKAKPDEVTVVTYSPHNLIEGDRFKIDLAEDDQFNTTDDELSSQTDNKKYSNLVTDVVSDYIFRHKHKAGDATYDVNIGDAILFHDTAEFIYELGAADSTQQSRPKYWGVTDYAFIDDYTVEGLTQILDTDDYDPPHEDMKGIRLAHNNILIGFFGNELCFSEPSQAHAWPEKYRLKFDEDIVDAVPVAGRILVLTTGYPYLVEGFTPESIRASKMDYFFPCLSKPSVVEMLGGVAWSTHRGLAIYSPTSGATIVTQSVHSEDTWNQTLDATTLKGHLFEGKYYGSHSTGAFIYEFDPANASDPKSGSWTDCTQKFSAAFSEPNTGRSFIIKDEGSPSGVVHEWDSEDYQLGALPMHWKSKRFITPSFVNFGAARIVSEAPEWEAGVVDRIDEDDRTRAENQVTINDILASGAQFGTLNSAGLNSRTVNGFIGEKPTTVSSIAPTTLEVFADEKTKSTKTATDHKMFRLPAGYKSDTHEFEIRGTQRVRSVHIAETPTGLKQV